jgi:hypothetical protein
MPGWIRLLWRVGAILLSSFPQLDKVSTIIVAAIEAAEKIPGLRGRAKKEYAMRAIAAGVAATNAAAGKTVIDPSLVNATVSNAIDLLVNTLNLWHDATKDAVPDDLEAER